MMYVVMMIMVTVMELIVEVCYNRAMILMLAKRTKAVRRGRSLNDDDVYMMMMCM